MHTQKSKPFWQTCLSALTALVMVLGMLSFTAPPAALAAPLAPTATQILGGVAVEGNLRIEMYDSGRIGIYRYTSGAWATMVYNGWDSPGTPPDKGSLLKYGAGDATGYYFGWFERDHPAAANVSNTKVGNTVTTVWTGGATARITQTVTYNDGDDFVRYDWAIQNTQGTALSNVRFYHGMDSCMGATGPECTAAGDSGMGLWDAAAQAVGAYRVDAGVERRFYLQGVTLPYAYESDGWPSPWENAIDGDLANVADPTDDDNQYALEWRNTSLAAGAVWTITAYERFSISADEEDWGDLPNTYNTSSFNNGPRHIILGGAPILGSVAPDAEIDGQPTANADGDDTNGVPDDEDGVTRATGLGSGTGGWTNGAVAGGQGGAVDVTISTASACLGAFFDFNGSGTLSAATLRNNTGAAVSQPLAAGSYTFYFNVPAGTFPGGGPDVPVYGRFRVTSPVSGDCTGSPAYSSTGSAPDGEVEDYVWTFTTTAVALRGFGAAGGLWGMGLIIALAAGLVVVRRRNE